VAKSSRTPGRSFRYITFCLPFREWPPLDFPRIPPFSLFGTFRSSTFGPPHQRFLLPQYNWTPSFLPETCSVGATPPQIFFRLQLFFFFFFFSTNRRRPFPLLCRKSVSLFPPPLWALTCPLDFRIGDPFLARQVSPIPPACTPETPFLMDRQANRYVPAVQAG